MSDIAIKVENLGKSYSIGHNTHEGKRYTALRDVIARNAKNFIRTTRDMVQGKSIIQGDEVEEFWALKDVSFEIKQGDRVGIIGRNGAGKSTLLKILSRITEPTQGRVQINGRVASLLEVGTGFHPELTGRENIFLNGAILGMSRREIQRKFDEIVDFSEVEKFLDTPVKRYSSGMYVRLAFAVAAHLEPEILIVDEVLAVGDAHFQKKCLGKMDDVARGGRTVLFVSHNLDAVSKICSNGICLKNGHMVKHALIFDAIQSYQADQASYISSAVWKSKSKNSNYCLDSISLMDNNGKLKSDFSNQEDLTIVFNYSKLPNNKFSRLVFSIYDQNDHLIMMSSNYDLISSSEQKTEYIAKVKSPLLTQGKYFLSVRLDLPNLFVIENHEKCMSFTVSNYSFHQMGIIALNEYLGSVHVPVSWS